MGCKEPTRGYGLNEEGGHGRTIANDANRAPWARKVSHSRVFSGETLLRKGTLKSFIGRGV